MRAGARGEAGTRGTEEAVPGSDPLGGVLGGELEEDEGGEDGANAGAHGGAHQPQHQLDVGHQDADRQAHKDHAHGDQVEPAQT